MPSLQHPRPDTPAHPPADAELAALMQEVRAFGIDPARD